MRRFALLLGAGSLAVTLTLATLFGGLGLGGLLGRRIASDRPARRYALLEAAAACWALGLPVALSALTPWVYEGGLVRGAGVVVLLALPPAMALGATFPVLACGLPERAASLYAANTAGAVCGTLAVPALLLPLFGVTGGERVAAGLGLLVAAVAWHLPLEGRPSPVGQGRGPLVAVAVAGLVAMSLEVAWTRLGSVMLGPSIHAFAWVLAVFLAGIALGAMLKVRTHHALGALGLLALLGTLLYGEAPLLLAWLYDLWGPRWMGLIEALLSALTMAGAPVASGAVFASVLANTPAERVYGVNTLAGVIGSAATGLWLLPLLGVQGVVCAGALLAAACASVLHRRPWWLLAVGVLVLVQPQWQGQLFAVGIYNRVSDLGDRSRGGVQSFAETGWELLSYRDGRTGAVAVGRSTRTGTVWLSINGKVDASTGEDMPTQVLSGQIPVRMHPSPRRVLVVGLASGVTAGAVLEEGVAELTVVELEQEVVAASHHFDHVNGRPLEDERTTLLVRDARAVLSRPSPPWDVIISEPSNPWITGVSNLFTLEYWELGRQRLGPDGIFCQWVQLYGLAVTEFRSVVRTFGSVFPRAWLFEPLQGGDVLLVGSLGEPDLDDLPIAPVLGPEGVQRLGQGARFNTDEHPWVELEAPRSLHLATVEDNQALIRQARTP